MIDTIADLNTRFPLPDQLRDAWSLDGKQAFARRFISARDQVEAAFYAELDRQSTAGERTRKFVGALFNPIIGRPVRDPAHFYETFGRLMRRAWLSVSVGIYNDDIRAVPEPAVRLHTAQVNTVDLAWQPAISTVPANGTLVEIGTGRGNSVARLGELFPQARIISITISPEQADIARQTVAALGLTNVEIRLGDIFDPTITADLVGQADAVAAIEVTGHFAPDRKAPGIGMFARLLKPGAPLSLMDSASPRRLNPLLENYYHSQSWYFGSYEGYAEALRQANVDYIACINHTAASLDTFIDTSTVLRRYRPQLRQEFGRLMALVWPELPRTIYYRTVQMIDYVQLTGIRQG